MYIKYFQTQSQQYIRHTTKSTAFIATTTAGRYRFFSGSQSIVSFDYKGKNITLEFRGVSNNVKNKRNCGNYAETTRIIEARSTDLATCDALALGLGMHEMAAVNSYLNFQKFNGINNRQYKEFKNVKQVLRRYRHYIDMATSAANLGTHVLGIGRSKYAEAASFGEAATNNKMEVLRLCSLYLRRGNVLKDKEMLQEFKTVAPSIYNAVVEEGAFYSFCRLHEHIYNIDDNSISKRRNIRVLVLVDKWILTELVTLILTRLPTLIAHNVPPMTEALHAIDNRSRKKWSSFLMQFVVMPMILISGAFGYKLHKCLVQAGTERTYIGEGFAPEQQHCLVKGQCSVNDSSRD